MSHPLKELAAVVNRPLGHIQTSYQAPVEQWTGWSLDDRNPDIITDLLPLLRWFHLHYFRVQTEGWEQIPQGPVLLVGSHNGGLAAPELFMTMVDWFAHFGVERPVYGLMNAKMWGAYPGIARLAAQGGAVRAHPKMAIAALQSGASVLVYPGGARDVYRHHSLKHRIFLNGNLAFIKLALRENIPIVPVVSTGAHETLKVIADLYPFFRQWHQQGMPWILGIDPEVIPIYLGLPWGIGIGPLPNIPWPQPIRTRICPPITFSRSGTKACQDKDYLVACYDQVHQQMQSALDHLVQNHLVQNHLLQNHLVQKA